ncbi:ectonucleoside triphosphate diphosphohydrolase 2-like protein [Xyrichtys novacula]|uniref:Ectonucleoside triphosphate diphosphohydrolase 2-like protein n=1 Tax=Xyrichtys novacula TaxID=13765 RepID=A0AAV1EIL4_XYRNO|nr:ectonucleoside triphosphate diphosphohydrolase 2-like protein [Xyrichtys novacula]
MWWRSAIAPDLGDHLQLHIDITYRIGRRDGKRTRPVIIRSRAVKESIWKKAKGFEYLASRKLRFGEDLTAKDKETQNCLWPQIEAAHKEGKKAFFIGARAIIDERELRV